MRSLVQLKNTLESSKKRFEQQVKTTNDKNTELEKELVNLQVSIKREELIKELNTMKFSKKSDTFIATQQKNQSTEVQKLI